MWVIKRTLSTIGLLLLCGSVNAMMITDTLNYTLGDGVDYHLFSTSGGAFRIDVLGEGAGGPGIGLEDPEIWIIEYKGEVIGIDGVPVPALSGDVAPKGSTPIFDINGLFSDYSLNGVAPGSIEDCNKDGSVPYNVQDYADPCIEFADGVLKMDVFWLVVGEYDGGLFTLDQARSGKGGWQGGDYQLTLYGDVKLVSEPSIILLFSLGLAGLGLAGRRKERRN